MLLLAPSPAPKPKSSQHLPPLRWENYTRRSFVCGALFFDFSRKNFQNYPTKLRNQRKFAGIFPYLYL